MAISRRVAQMVVGSLRLNDDEREEFISLMNDVFGRDREKVTIAKEELAKSLPGVSFGPSPGGCPLCGK